MKSFLPCLLAFSVAPEISSYMDFFFLSSSSSSPPPLPSPPLSKLTESFLWLSVLKFHNNHLGLFSSTCIEHSMDPFNPASQFGGISLNHFVDNFLLFVSLFLELVLLRHWVSWIGFHIFLSFFSYFPDLCLFYVCASHMGNFLNTSMFLLTFVITSLTYESILFCSLKISFKNQHPVFVS